METGDPGADAAAPDAPPATGAVHYFSQEVEWMTGAVFATGWDGTHHRVAVNVKGADGLTRGYWASETGELGACVTCTAPDPAATQRGISDVFAGGDYVVLTVEKSVHPGTIGGSAAEPGKGLFNDLWIAKSDGSQAWQMTNLPADAGHGLIWARLDAQGKQIVWAEMYDPGSISKPKQIIGVWKVMIADITWSDGVPSFTNVRSYEPEAGNFYETYGFSPDGTQILFASSAFQAGVAETQIYRVSTALTGLTQLSDGSEKGWANYNEFAFYTQDGTHIIYGRVKESTSGGLDYWIMNPDGSHAERLTNHNEPWSPQTHGYTNTGGWALDPSDPTHLLGNTCPDLLCEKGGIQSIHLATTQAGNGTGVSADYFSDTTLTTKVMSRVDPYIGFNWGTGSPTSAMPANNFAVRWTGSLLPYTTGTHTLCTFDDDGARLWVDDMLVVDAWYNQSPSSHCKDVILDAGHAHSLKMEFYDAVGSASAKLTWQVPGQPANSQEVVPSSQLVPAQ
jgi:hypothetical protein